MPARKGRGGARPGSGPKPLPPEERRSEQLMVRFTPAEVREIRQAAGKQPLSAWLRDLVLRALARRR